MQSGEPDPPEPSSGELDGMGAKVGGAPEPRSPASVGRRGRGPAGENRQRRVGDEALAVGQADRVAADVAVEV